MKTTVKATLISAIACSVFMFTSCTADDLIKDSTKPKPIATDLSIYSDQYEACPKVTHKTLLDCNEQHGKLQKEGMMGCYTCVVMYEDAGKSCQDTSDCQGKCTITGKFLEYGVTNQYGQCEANNSPFGCYQTIENGVAGNALCVD